MNVNISKHNDRRHFLQVDGIVEVRLEITKDSIEIHPICQRKRKIKIDYKGKRFFGVIQ